jgi:hypothetical protein
MNVTIKTDSSVYLDRDGYIVSECYFDANVSEDPIMVTVTAISKLVQQAVAMWDDEDGIVRHQDGLEMMYMINSELKDAIDFLHNHIDDGVYLNEEVDPTN